jgi:hypothetical protein
MNNWVDVRRSYFEKNTTNCFAYDDEMLNFFKQKFKEAAESLLPGERKGECECLPWGEGCGCAIKDFNACREEMKQNLDKFMGEEE